MGNRRGEKMKALQVCGMLVAAFLSGTASCASPLLLDSAGRAIGFLWGDQSNCSNSGAYGVISRTGIFTCIGASNGRIASGVLPPGSGGFVGGVVEYESIDCSGGQLLCSGSGTPTGGFVVATYDGYKLASPGTAGAFYSQVRSKLDFTHQCETQAGSGKLCIPVVAADVATAGISLSPYSPPFRVEILPETALDDVIFFDGFDSSLGL